MASSCIIIFVCCVLMSFVTGKRLSEGFNSPPATEREGTSKFS